MWIAWVKSIAGGLSSFPPAQPGGVRDSKRRGDGLACRGADSDKEGRES